jgi:hypothetical protein
LFDLGGQEHVLIFIAHHLVFDGPAMEIFARELWTFYRQRTEGTLDRPLPDLASDYLKFATLNRSERLDRIRSDAYWHRKLAGLEPVELPLDSPRTERRTDRAWARSFVLEAGVAGALKALAQRESTVLFTILLAALYDELFRWTARRDLVVGTPLSRRSEDPAFTDLIGHFIDRMVIRTDFSGAATFEELLRLTHRSVTEAFAHNATPLNVALKTNNPFDDPAMRVVLNVRTNTNNVRMGAQNVPTSIQELITSAARSGVAMEPFDLRLPAQTRFDILLRVDNWDDGLIVHFLGSADLFEEKTIVALAQSLEATLKSVAVNPERSIFPARSNPRARFS